MRPETMGSDVLLKAGISLPPASGRTRRFASHACTGLQPRCRPMGQHDLPFSHRVDATETRCQELAGQKKQVGFAAAWG